MLWIAAALAASAPGLQAPHRAPDRPVVQARATVRILKAARLKWGEKMSDDLPPLKDSQVRFSGVSYPAKLVEFE